MTRFVLLVLACALVASGCGGAMYKGYEQSYAEAPAADYDADGVYDSPDAAGEMAYREELDYEIEGEYWADENGYAEMDTRGYGGAPGPLAEPAPAPPAMSARRMAKKAADSSVTMQTGLAGKSKPKLAQQSGQQVQDPQAQGVQKGTEPLETEEPLVVYTGFLKLRVKRLLEAVDEITKITEDQGGYIESLTRQVIVVRVPAKDFDEVIKTFASVGELLERRIKALDVTEQFTDLGARLAVAKEARARLVKLLEKTDDVEERLRILQEIKRLSEMIESIESTLSTLQNLVDYFTITIELEPILDESATWVHRSPFGWVRALSPHLTTIEDGMDEFEIDLPADFVLFEKDDVYRAQAADTTVIRGGVVDNEPLGNNAFWSDAVHHELEGRGEALVEDGEAGPVYYRLYRSDDIQPRYYLVAVKAHGDDLYVVEVFYPSEKAFEAHHKAVVEALGTFEVY
jgi:hypothetical protein